MPAFRQVLGAVTDAWRDRRDERARRRAADRRARIAAPAGARRAGAAGPRTCSTRRSASLPATYDERQRRLRRRAEVPAVDGAGVPAAHARPHRRPARWTWRAATLEAMARGGIYDQLAGGFARYSVDAGWVVPHFEKMLYDNALLLRVYLHLWRATGDAAGPAGSPTRPPTSCSRDLRTPEGGFASALDADTEGVEGLTYVWTPAQLIEVLGDDDGAWAAELLRGHRGRHVRARHVHAAAARATPTTPRGWTPVRRAAARGPGARARSRPGTTRSSPPGTGWRSPALAEHGVAARRRRRWVVAARGARPSCCSTPHLVDGRLRRAPATASPARRPACWRTTATWPRGCSRCTRPPRERRWLDLRGRPARRRRWPSSPTADGGFHDTADDAEPLVRRPFDPTDGPTPSGAAAAAGALRHLRRAGRLGPPPRAAAEAALASLAPAGRGVPAGRRLGGRGRRGRCWPGRCEVAVSGPAGPQRGRAGRGRAGVAEPGRGRRGRRAGRAGRAAAGRPAAGRRAAGRVRLPRVRLRRPVDRRVRSAAQRCARRFSPRRTDLPCDRVPSA